MLAAFHVTFFEIFKINCLLSFLLYYVMLDYAYHHFFLIFPFIFYCLNCERAGVSLGAQGQLFLLLSAGEKQLPAGCCCCCCGRCQEPDFPLTSCSAHRHRGSAPSSTAKSSKPSEIVSLTQYVYAVLKMNETRVLSLILRHIPTVDPPYLPSI